MFYGVCHAQVFGVAVCSAGFVCSEPGYSVLAGNSSMRAGLLRGLSASLSDLQWLDHVQLVGAKRFCRSAVRSRCSLSPRPKIDVPTLIGTPGTPPTVAAPTASAFQAYLVVVKVRARMAWCVQPGAVAVVTGAAW